MKRALDNPEKFYWNVLLEEDDNTIPLSDTNIHLCVLLYLVTNLDLDDRIIETYINRYMFQLENEIYMHKKLLSESQKELYSQCERYPIIRDLIYKDEKEHLLKSVTKQDYLNYLSKYSDSCREFTLFAKFQIAQFSQMRSARFEHISEVINSFPNSDLFDVEHLKTLCVNINGVSICFTHDATAAQKDTILGLIRDSIFNNESKSYIINAPLSKLQIINLLKFNTDILNYIINNIEGIQLLNISDVKSLLSILNDLTGLSWDLPQNELELDNDMCSKDKYIIWTKENDDSDSIIERYYALQPILKLKEL